MQYVAGWGDMTYLPLRGNQHYRKKLTIEK